MRGHRIDISAATMQPEYCGIFITFSVLMKQCPINHKRSSSVSTRFLIVEHA